MKYIVEVESIDEEFEEEIFTYEYNNFDDSFETLKSESKLRGYSAELNYEDKEGFHSLMFICGELVHDIYKY